MTGVAWWTCALLAVAGARVFERCELARELQRLGLERETIPTWVCIAYHESRLDTAALNPGSGDHGLLQISELFWCGPAGACALPCAALRDDDIADDVRCALQIHEEHTRLQGDGFLAWVVYPTYCKHTTKKYLADCDNYVKNYTFKVEDKPSARAYDNTNFTFTRHLKIDELKPPYLTINSLLRDRQRYNSIPTENNWVNFRIDNIDELKLPVFGASLTTPAPVVTSPVTTTQAATYKPTGPATTTPTTRFAFTTPAPTVQTTRSTYYTTTVRQTPRFSFTSAAAAYKPSTRSYLQFTTPKQFKLQTLTTIGSTARPTLISTTPTTVKSTTPAIMKSTKSYLFRSPPTTTTRPTPPATYRYTTVPFLSTTKRSFFTFAPVRETTSRLRSTTRPVTFRKIKSSRIGNYVPPAPTPSTTFRTLPAFTVPKYRSSPGYSTTPRPFTTVSRLSTTPRPLSTFKSFPRGITNAESVYDLPQANKTTLSVFDLYLKPTRQPKLLPFSVPSRKSPYKLSIFSGGTTAAPTAIIRDPKQPFGGAARNHFRRHIFTLE